MNIFLLQLESLPFELRIDSPNLVKEDVWIVNNLSAKSDGGGEKFLTSSLSEGCIFFFWPPGGAGGQKY